MKKQSKKAKTKFSRLHIKKPIQLIAILGLLLIGTTAVWAMVEYTKKDIRMNSMIVKNLRGDIIESFDKNTEVGNQVESKKEAKIKNVGNINLFVRVMVFPEITNTKKVTLPATIVKENAGKSTGQIVLLGMDESKWLDGEDGYYYYLDKLAPGASTPNLFKNVKIDGSVVKQANAENKPNQSYHYYSYDQGTLKIMLKEETISSIGSTYNEAWNFKNDNNEFVNPALEKVDQILAPLTDKK